MSRTSVKDDQIHKGFSVVVKPKNRVPKYSVQKPKFIGCRPCGRNKTNVRPELRGQGDESSDEEEETYAVKKVIRDITRADGADLLDNCIRLGPQVIFEFVECTPIPLFCKGSTLKDFKEILKKDSLEIIPLTPELVDSTTDGPQQGLGLGQGEKSLAMTWTANLTDFEEEEFLAESAFLENIKLAYHLPLEADGSQKYETHNANLMQPDGSILVKERVRIILTETPTVYTLQIHGKCVKEGLEDYEKVKANNERYKLMCQRHLESDAYTDRNTQTFVNRERDKSTQMNGVTVVDMEQTVTHYFITDEFASLAEKEALQKRKEEEDAIMQSFLDKMREETMGEEEYKGSSDSDEDENEKLIVVSKVDWGRLDAEEEADMQEPPSDVDDDELQMTSEDEFDIELSLDEIYEKRAEKARNQKPKFLPDLTRSVTLLERILSTNRYQFRHMDIRGFEPIVKKEKEHRFQTSALSKATALVEKGPKLQRYWSYIAPLVKAQEITCVAVHPTNGNLIAASYGGTRFSNPPEGLVCIWNLKSITYPERVYKFHISATSIAFSNLTPYLLAIGLLDGNIVVYDIRQPEPAPISSTLKSLAKPDGPIWDLFWLQEAELASTGAIVETLISISDDGFVYRWNSSKGFDPIMMLKVRRSPIKIPGRREKRAEALISQLSASYKICFYPEDPTQYLIGTEEGFIHKATTSYTEQYLATYVGHSGPVYAIQFSPFASNIFISCGGDWRIKIWKEDVPTCLLTLTSGLRTVFDVNWCPNMSAVFVCVSEINIEIWDLTVNTLEPIIQFKPPFSIGLRKVCFWEYTRSLIIGDDDGGMTVYQLCNFTCQPDSLDEQIDQLLTAIDPNYKSILERDETEDEDEDESEYDSMAFRNALLRMESGASLASSKSSVKTHSTSSLKVEPMSDKSPDKPKEKLARVDSELLNFQA